MVKAVAPKPVNVLMGLAGVDLGFDELKALGVKRISVGSSLARVAYGAFFDAAKRIRGDGRFDYGDKAMTFAQLNDLFRR